MTSPYDAPDDLPEESAEATCQTDVVILVEEPMVQGSAVSRPSGFSWTGVEGIKIRLSGGGRRFDAATDSSGRATFPAVPCGAYQIALRQDEFRINSFDTLSMTVAGVRKSGREKEIKITRQLLTVEMFRLPTHYWESVRLNTGKQPNPTINDDPYGHHWLKIYASEADALAEIPSESYGWWPKAGAGFPDFLTGVPGDLNGATNYGGSSTRDPYHTKYSRSSPSLEEVFFPFVTNGKTAAAYKADIKSKAQGFSTDVSSEWSWRTDGGGWHCKSFQDYIMREVRLWKRLGTGLGTWGWSANT